MVQFSTLPALLLTRTPALTRTLFAFFFCCISLLFVVHPPRLDAQNARYTPLTPEQVKVVMHSTQRLVVPLAGEWQRSSLTEPEWQRVTLPYSETTNDEFRYRRTFVIDDNLIKRYEWQLYSLGCNYRAEIYVNNQYLMSHVGGSVPFQVRIPDSYLRNGNNTLEIVVNNQLDASSTLPLRSTPHVAKNYGGIVRELFLVGMPSVFLSNVDTRTSFINNDLRAANLQITTSLTSGNLFQFIQQDSSQTARVISLQKTTVEITAELRSIGDSGVVVARATPTVIEIQANRNAQVKLNLSVIEPRLWSPASPNLYSLVVTVRRGNELLDDYTTEMGLYNVRTALTDEKITLYLNGQPTKIKAVDYNEDSENGGGTMNVSDYERDVLLLKTLGANVLHVRYTTPHLYFVHLCDKYGLILLVDLPVRGVPASILGKENYIVGAQTIAKDIIQAFENHPSILGIGLSEEVAEGTPELATYSQKVRDVIRASSAKLIYKTVRSKAESLDATNVDFVIFTMQDEEGQEFRTEAERLRSMNSNKLSIFNFTKLSQPDNHKGYSDPLSVEAQARYIRQRFRVLQEYKISDNVIIGCFSDYITERPILITNTTEQYIATSGLVDRARSVRLPYLMLKALFNDEKEPVLDTGNYQAEAPAFYTVISVTFIIIFFVLINTSRRFREDVLRALLRPYNFYSDIRDQRILSNAGTFTLALMLSVALGLVVSSVLYFLRFSVLLDYVLTHFIVSNTIKEFVNTIVWQPWASCLIAALLFFVVLGVLTLCIRACSLFVKSRIFTGDAFVITTWAFLPLGFLLIMTAGLYRILTTNIYALLSLLLITYIFLWCIYRMLRGIAVIYDIRALQVYAIGLFLIGLFATILVFYYDRFYSTLAFANYFFSVLYH
jgi:hypothetical protein